ncbi:unnamed protein product [Scytosiphon promiscuus]
MSPVVRFARNGGVDAKDFQRMWREMDKSSHHRGVSLAGAEGTSRLGGVRDSAGPQQERREGEGGDRIDPDKIFEFGQLFQKFDTDGDGRLGRGDFERMIGGLLGRLDGAGSGGVGGGRERKGSNGAVEPTTGVPLAREAVASQQALGHTIVPLSEAYGRRLSRLQSLASSRLMPVRERLLQLRRRFHGRSEEVRAAKSAIERETLADAEAIVERLRSVEALKQATLAQGVNGVTAELEVVEKLADQVVSVTALSSSASDSQYPSIPNEPDFEGTEKMVELIQSYRELCNSIDRVANRPFDPNIGVRADDYPHETAERLEVLRRADQYEQALGVKDQMVWAAMQESELLKQKCQEERTLGQDFAEEAQEWVKLTGKLSDRVNALTAETQQMARLQKENAFLIRENEELTRRVADLQTSPGSTS